MQLARFKTIGNGPTLEVALCIKEDFTWQLQVRGVSLSFLSTPLSSFPPTLVSVSAVERLLSFVNSCTFCCGNLDKKYQSLAESKKGKFIDVSGEKDHYSIVI